MTEAEWYGRRWPEDKNLSLRERVERSQETRSCLCVGPQDGQPLCPCRMRSVKVVDGRYVETIDHGPVRTSPFVTRIFP
jgi:hypothetical protein